MSTPSNTFYLTDGVAQGSATGGVPVSPSGAYPPASFVATPAQTLPASIADFVGSDPRDNLAWIRQAFMLNTLSNNDISTQDMARRIATTAAWNYNDTTLGGNWAINPAPQFTEFADITMGGDQTYQNAPNRTTMTTSQSYGEGRIYHEVLERNAQYVTMSFGVQAFNSLTSFFGNFYDPQASQLVRTGRGKSVFFQIGQLGGYLLAVPFKPLVFANSLVKNALNIPATKFSYFKPTMTLYWNSVNTMLNGITANIGIHNRQLDASQQQMYVDPNSASTAPNATSDITADLADMARFLPDIYQPIAGSTQNGAYIDAYAVASRAQRLADAFTKKIQTALDQAANMNSLQSNLLNVISGNLDPSPLTYPTLSSALVAYLQNVGGQSGSTTGDGTGTVEGMSLDSSQSSAANSSSDNTGGTTGATGTATNNATPSSSPTTGQAPDSSAAQGTGTNSTVPSGSSPSTDSGKAAGWWSQFWDSLKADLADGANYVTFKTNYGGEIGESFSNSMKQSDIQQKINSMSSDARSTSFDFAGGNVVGGALGSLVGKAVGAVSDVVSGVLAGVQLSGLAALTGAAYVDIPMMYDSSDVSLPSQSFTIELRSWSGHRLALLQNIYFPLACLLAAVMPRATGASSWNAPFCCQLFAKGRMQIRNGMISDMSITRGVGNMGFAPETNLPLAVDVTFTVKDFSTMMYMPVIATTGFLQYAVMGAGQTIGGAAGEIASTLGINTNASQGAANGENIAAALTSAPYSDASIFSDYLAVLAALGWKDQVYPMRKWSIARERAVLDYETFKSPYHAAGWVNGTLIGQLISGVVHGTDRP